METGHASSSQRRIELSLELPGYVIASVGSLAITVTREPPSTTSVRDFTRTIDELHERYPNGVAVLIAPRAPRPALSAEATRHIVSHWKRLEPQLSCAVILFRASGFVSAIQRSLTTAVMGMHQGTSPLKASANPFEAAEFIVRHDANHSAPKLLGAALRDFIRAYES